MCNVSENKNRTAFWNTANRRMKHSTVQEESKTAFTLQFATKPTSKLKY